MQTDLSEVRARDEWDQRRLIEIGMAHDSEGNVYFDFRMPIMSFALPQDQALAFARAILKHCGVQKLEITL